MPNPVIFLGKRHKPNASKEEQYNEGLSQVRIVCRDSFRSLVNAMHAIPAPTRLDEDMKAVYAEIVLYVCFGATMFYIESPRYNLEFCQKHEAERCRSAKKRACR